MAAASHHSPEHTISLRTYLLIWAALVVLTVVTVAVSRIDLGSFNTLVAIAIATLKASLVALFFMHLRYDNKFNLLVLLCSLVFIGLFFIPTFIDELTRERFSGNPDKWVPGYKINQSPRTCVPSNESVSHPVGANPPLSSTVHGH